MAPIFDDVAQSVDEKYPQREIKSFNRSRIHGSNWGNERGKGLDVESLSICSNFLLDWNVNLSESFLISELSVSKVTLKKKFWFLLYRADYKYYFYKIRTDRSIISNASILLRNRSNKAKSRETIFRSNYTLDENNLKLANFV